MAKVSESIFSGKTVIIPMADVQHIEKQFYHGILCGYFVITKHTKRNYEIGCWENSIFLTDDEGKIFLQAWCNYRHELEGGADVFINPED